MSFVISLVMRLEGFRIIGDFRNMGKGEVF